MQNLQGVDFFQLNHAFWIAERKVNVPLYDFQFSPLFHITRPRTDTLKAIIARLGAIDLYDQVYEDLKAIGFRLINSPQEHDLASELAHWYPQIQAFTPRSMIFEQVPTADQILEHFELPVFIKGNRQTAKHNPRLAIATNRAELEFILKSYQQNTILHWQKLVCREFIPLQKLDYQTQNTVPVSFEFRTFWWRETLVGAGPYWSHLVDYNWTSAQQREALQIASQAAQRLKIPFLVIDVALTAQGKWIIIECNDGQESGYAGIDAAKLWRNILTIEKQQTT
ncbi:hypothetical protein BKI52_21790 [marine bacterium AO1-C]|nr:hypothetical protein BKI52_21790 [marine bacterium AO1-C]